MKTYIIRISNLIVVTLQADEPAAIKHATEIARKRLAGLYPSDEVVVKSITTLDTIGHCAAFFV